MSIYCSLEIGIVFIHLFLVRSLDKRYNNTHGLIKYVLHIHKYIYSKPID